MGTTGCACRPGFVQAELALSQLKLNDVISVVEFYQALGGGGNSTRSNPRCHRRHPRQYDELATNGCHTSAITDPQ